MAEGVDGLLREETRSPGTPRTPDEKVAEVIRLTRDAPPHEATHWTIRAMGKAVRLAASTVREIWKAHGLPENHYLPGALKAAIGDFIDHYNNHRFHESICNVTPADAYFGRADAIISEGRRIKEKTMKRRRLINQRHAAQP